MSADELRLSLFPFTCEASSNLPSSLSGWGGHLADSLSKEISVLLEKAKIQAVLDYKSRPSGCQASQVMPYDLLSLSVHRPDKTEISAVPPPPLVTVKTRTSVFSVPAGLFLVSEAELATLREQSASLAAEVDRLKLALQEEICDHQKTRLLLESRPAAAVRPPRPPTPEDLGEFSDSLDPLPLTPPRPWTPEDAVAPLTGYSEISVQTENFEARKSEISVNYFREISDHPLFPTMLSAQEAELVETRARMQAEFLRVHEAFGVFRTQAAAESEQQGRKLRLSEASERRLVEEGSAEEQRRRRLEFELEELRSQFQTTVSFAESVFQELERTKKFESIATEAKYEIHTLKTYLHNLHSVACENEKSISLFNSSLSSAKTELATAVRTFTAGFEFTRPPPPSTALVSTRPHPYSRDQTRKMRNTFPRFLPPVEDKKKLWRKELDVPDTPRN